jgi:hypothetical protein
MSAAATAAGYLYASGRLRGKSKEGEPGGPRGEAPGVPQPRRRAEGKPEARGPAKRRPLRVAVLREPEHFEEPRPTPASRRAVKIEYRTRRWRPDAD